MQTAESLEEQLQAMGMMPDDCVLIHSSYKAVGEFDEGPSGLIKALMAYFKDGLLVFPTHTWRQINSQNPLFDPLTEPACVGLLPNLFMAQPGVHRSLHPTHSVAAFGREAASFVAGDERLDTPCGRQGCWGKLLDQQAKILFLGATLKTNTFIHGVEEWNQVPGRLTPDREALQIKLPTGVLAAPQHRHIGDVSQHYDKLYQPFVTHHLIREGQIGAAQSFVIEAQPIFDFVSDLLKREPDLFATAAPIPTEYY